MIVSEKSHKNISDYIQFLPKKIEFNNKRNISSKKNEIQVIITMNMLIAHSFFRKDF